MNDSERMPLAAQLRQLARDLRGEQPPPHLLKAVHGRLDRHRPRPRRWAWAAMGTACAAAIAWMAIAGFAPSPTASGTDALAGFVPVAGNERWREAAQGSAWLVSTELPHQRLAALGLPYDPTRAADTVRAQLLMHSSGDVLAVRVIR